MPSGQKLTNLFDLYISDLQACTPSLGEIFLCPLCFKKISRVENLGEVVSEEHIIPSSIGGSITTLTCKSCNNSDGSSLDANLIQRLRIENRRHSIKSRVRIGSGEFGAEVCFPEDTDSPIRITGIPKQTNIHSAQKAQEALRNGVNEISLKLDFDYNDRKSNVGLLRVAYLMMFRCFGYRYILQKSLEQVRTQIKNPLLDTPVLKGISWEGISSDIPFSSVVMAISNPDHLRAFLVLISLAGGTKLHSGVIMPGMGECGETIYERLGQLTQKTSLEMKLVTEVPPATVLNPADFWRSLS